MSLWARVPLSIRGIYLNSNFTAHKLILIYSEHKSEVAQALATRIQRELQGAHLNAHQTDKIIRSPQVPYTVVINQRTMMDGVLLLQHFKPQINEEVHVSQLTERLLLQTGAIALRCGNVASGAAAAAGKLERPREYQSANVAQESGGLCTEQHPADENPLLDKSRPQDKQTGTS